MRISLVILGIALIAGIWLGHRLRTRAATRDEEDDAADWGDEAVHIRASEQPGQKRWFEPAEPGSVSEPEAGWGDPLDTGSVRTGGAREPAFEEPHLPGANREQRHEPHLGVTANDEPDLEPDYGRRGDRAQDIYGVLDSDEEPTPPPPHGAFEPSPEDRPVHTRRKGRASAPVERVRAALGGMGARLRAGMERVRPERLKPARAEDTLGEHLHPDHEVDPDLIEKPAPDMETLGEYVSEPRVVGRNPKAERRATDEKILLLHVVAPRNKPFTGVALGAAMQRAGMTPGEMDIYHFQEPETDNRVPLFSAANMVPPGTLREEDLADMMTPGVTLFTQVHRSAEPQRAFEALLEHAHVLARDLGGSILDAQQSTATNQTLAYMREDLNDWLRRHRPDVLRRRSTR
ncbi:MULTISPECIES: cell division protein ZipA C-terminal FtsZ-binding domain-containing protein [unclassified Thioalkalivibrio]|uniref:cell division protein ZipA C-terminal FtsZ-binding domain-containing protein n=1 Tax=unclassified Thioalkalivibrio TaxID=2621013 RepID=UPI000361897A|nr:MULTISPECIES: cell division protein ZipA C-terminal FtsZ-binding domain-containing protein [unclassified Thioalkalivibrio]